MIKSYKTYEESGIIMAGWCMCEETSTRYGRFSQKEELFILVPAGASITLHYVKQISSVYFSPIGQEYPFLQVSEIFYPGLISQPRLESCLNLPIVA